MFAKPAPPKKKALPGMPPPKPKTPMDDLESPDPVEGKPAPPPIEESVEPPAEEDTEGYGGKLLGDMLRPLTEAGLEDADAKALLAKILRGAADCLGGEGEDSGLDIGSADLPEGGE